ncbi:MAG: hypothetical protein WCN95_04755 [bacterium]
MSIVGKTAIVGIAVAVALALGGIDALAKGKGNKGNGKASEGVRGKVTAVDNSSITVESKKNGSKKFTIDTNTVYKSASAGKNKQAVKPAVFADVKTGERVIVKSTGDQATKVTIIKGGKKGAGKGKKNK